MTVEFARRGAGTKYPTGELKVIAGEILKVIGRDQAELSVSLVGDREMRPLNARYRKKNRTTDVLAFPAEDAAGPGAPLLGDVIISVEQARRQARERKEPLKNEMVTLLIHGILHLVGYDHERSARQARIMAAAERNLRSRLCERGLIKV